MNVDRSLLVSLVIFRDGPIRRDGRRSPRGPAVIRRSAGLTAAGIDRPVLLCLALDEEAGIRRDGRRGVGSERPSSSQRLGVLADRAGSSQAAGGLRPHQQVRNERVGLRRLGHSSPGARKPSRASRADECRRRRSAVCERAPRSVSVPRASASALVSERIAGHSGCVGLRQKAAGARRSQTRPRRSPRSSRADGRRRRPSTLCDVTPRGVRSAAVAHRLTTRGLRPARHPWRPVDPTVLPIGRPTRATGDDHCGSGSRPPKVASHPSAQLPIRRHAIGFDNRFYGPGKNGR